MAKRKPRNQFVLKHDNGTYYTGMTGIGPRFGGTLTGAHRFKNRVEAVREMGRHWAFGSCVVEETEDD